MQRRKWKQQGNKHSRVFLFFLFFNAFVSLRCPFFPFFLWVGGFSMLTFNPFAIIASVDINRCRFSQNEEANIALEVARALFWFVSTLNTLVFHKAFSIIGHHNNVGTSRPRTRIQSSKERAEVRSLGHDEKPSYCH